MKYFHTATRKWENLSSAKVQMIDNYNKCDLCALSFLEMMEDDSIYIISACGLGAATEIFMDFVKDHPALQGLSYKQALHYLPIDVLIRLYNAIDDSTCDEDERNEICCRGYRDYIVSTTNNTSKE